MFLSCYSPFNQNLSDKSTILHHILDNILISSLILQFGAHLLCSLDIRRKVSSIHGQRVRCGKQSASVSAFQRKVLSFHTPLCCYILIRHILLIQASPYQLIAIRLIIFHCQGFFRFHSSFPQSKATPQHPQ